MRVILIATLLAFGASAYAADVTQCDRVAAHPSDPDRISPGFHDKDIDKPKAITLCEAAVKADPNNARLRYQLGRVYFYAKQPDKAVPHLEFAADAGYRQAQFVLGYIVDGAQQGLKREPCRVEDLWLKSARAGRFAAQVSYAHHAMRGKFEGCRLQASTAEIGAFLDAARKGAEDYYQTLLVATLAEDFAAYAKSH
jgi:tetratricopeptide (TPR) repeat protein